MKHLLEEYNELLKASCQDGLTPSELARAKEIESTILERQGNFMARLEAFKKPSNTASVTVILADIQAKGRSDR